jgi:hypothetical protein
VRFGFRPDVHHVRLTLLTEMREFLQPLSPLSISTGGTSP